LLITAAPDVVFAPPYVVARGSVDWGGGVEKRRSGGRAEEACGGAGKDGAVMKRVCVFAGSSPGVRPEYRTAAAALGRAVAARGLGVVYGGAHVGLMGVLADAALGAGGEAIGVIPRALVGRELAHTGLTDLHVVESMHERKALMAALSDGFIALPGGWGTLDELFEILTWAQLGLHHKPVGLLNVQGYFDRLLSFVEHSIDEGFVRPDYRRLIASADAPEPLLDLLAVPTPATVAKWIDRAAT
jgi:uncharacterized protein (TIGR00730 family)